MDYEKKKLELIERERAGEDVTLDYLRLELKSLEPKKKPPRKLFLKAVLFLWFLQI